jgi:hypothetical protein
MYSSKQTANNFLVFLHPVKNRLSPKKLDWPVKFSVKDLDDFFQATLKCRKKKKAEMSEEQQILDEIVLLVSTVS